MSVFLEMVGVKFVPVTVVDKENEHFGKSLISKELYVSMKLKQLDKG